MSPSRPKPAPEVAETPSVHFSNPEQTWESAQSSDDLVNIVEAYAQLKVHPPDAEHPAAKLSIAQVVQQCMKQASALCEDDQTGMAYPNTVGDIALPAIKALVSNQPLRAICDETMPSDRPRGLQWLVNHAFMELSSGTAERFGGAHIVRALSGSSKGWDNRVFMSSPLLGEAYWPEKKYITLRALAHLASRGVGDGTLPHERPKARQAMWQVIDSTIRDQAEQGKSERPGKMIDFYEDRLKTKSARVDEAEFCIGLIFVIADEMTKQLGEFTPKQRGLKIQLDTFEHRPMTRLPFAFDRLLYVMGRGLLTEATSPGLYGPKVSTLRHRRLYLEALARRWDYASTSGNPSMGDLDLRYLDAHKGWVTRAQVNAALRAELNKDVAPVRADSIFQHDSISEAIGG